jgi:hypothetical protein
MPQIAAGTGEPQGYVNGSSALTIGRRVTRRKRETSMYMELKGDRGCQLRSRIAGRVGRRSLWDGPLTAIRGFFGRGRAARKKSAQGK